MVLPEGRLLLGGGGGVRRGRGRVDHGSRLPEGHWVRRVEGRGNVVGLRAVALGTADGAFLSVVHVRGLDGHA